MVEGHRSWAEGLQNQNPGQSDASACAQGPSQASNALLLPSWMNQTEQRSRVDRAKAETDPAILESLFWGPLLTNVQCLWPHRQHGNILYVT